MGEKHSLPDEVDLRDAVAQINGSPFNDRDQAQRAMLFLAGALAASSTAHREIARRTGLTNEECLTWCRKAREQNIFVGRRIAGREWFDEETGGVAFIMDAMCLVGILKRAPAHTPPLSAPKERG